MEMTTVKEEVEISCETGGSLRYRLQKPDSEEKGYTIEICWNKENNCITEQVENITNHLAVALQMFYALINGTVRPLNLKEILYELIIR